MVGAPTMEIGLLLGGWGGAGPYYSNGRTEALGGRAPVVTFIPGLTSTQPISHSLMFPIDALPPVHSQVVKVYCIYSPSLSHDHSARDLGSRTTTLEITIVSHPPAQSPVRLCGLVNEYVFDSWRPTRAKYSMSRAVG